MSKRESDYSTSDSNDSSDSDFVAKCYITHTSYLIVFIAFDVVV